MKTTAEKKNVYQMVTDRVLEQMSKGIIPWQKPWHGGSQFCAINYVTRKEYSFINQMLLGKSGEWLTWKQIKDCGGKLNKGAKKFHDDNKMIVWAASRAEKAARYIMGERN